MSRLIGRDRTGSAKRLYRTGKASFERRSDQVDLSSFPRGAGASPKRFRAGNRTRSPSPFPPPAFFRVGRRRPSPWSPSVRAPSWKPSLGFRWLCRHSFPWVPSWLTFGEGLGGGYRTPPNRTWRERSELRLGGLGGRKTAAERKLSTGDFSRARIREGLKMIKQKINRRNYLILN